MQEGQEGAQDLLELRWTASAGLLLPHSVGQSQTSLSTEEVEKTAMDRKSRKVFKIHSTCLSSQTAVGPGLWMFP